MRWILIFTLMALAGCSGYRYTQQDNPLSQYGIHSLSVPMFHNYSNLPDASATFTRETYRLLTHYSGLKLISGYKKSSDAVLIGIVKSPEKMHESLMPLNPRVAQTKTGNAIGSERQNFYIPGTTMVHTYLQVILIKKPTEEELTLLKSGIGDKLKLTSRVIINDTIPLRVQYTREIFDENAVDVTATQNAGVQRKTLRTLSEQAALSVRDMILYAF